MAQDLSLTAAITLKVIKFKRLDATKPDNFCSPGLLICYIRFMKLYFHVHSHYVSYRMDISDNILE